MYLAYYALGIKKESFSFCTALVYSYLLFVLPSFIRIFFNHRFKKILSLGIKKRKFFFLYCPRLFVSLPAEKKTMVESV